MGTQAVKRRKATKGVAPEAAAVSPVARTAAVSVLLVALVWFVFGQTLRHDFVNYDDPSYVYENATVSKGLTLDGIAWAFTQPHARNWHPLTTISHMVDCQLFGLNAGAHHFTSVLLHSLTAVLLFVVVQRMTGAFWRSAFVAAVFALHPLRVESVAWVAERKDVLSGLFFVLSLWAYHKYTLRRSAGRYVLLLICVALGLMSKPMLVTLPVVFLLLDHWPLRRWPLVSARALLLEKLPLFALAAAAGLATLLIQKTGGAMTESLPLTWRITNAFVSCVLYLRDLFWPGALAPFYPHPEGGITAVAAVGAILLVLGITAAAVLQRRENPYLITGWLWYLCMLAPVIGIIDVGAQARADRYTYLPQIGILLMLSWGARDLSAAWKLPRVPVATIAGLAVMLLAWRAHAQTKHWRNSETLWAHTLAVTSDNHVAHNNLGELHTHRGETDAALRHYEKALEIRSRSRRGRHDFLLALYHNNVGTALQQKRAVQEAVLHYRRAIEIQPDYPAAYLNLGGALVELTELDEAIAVFQKLIELNPSDATAHSSMATAFLAKGTEREAVSAYERALEIDANAMTALNNLGWLLATSADPSIRNPPRSLLLIERAIAAGGEQGGFLLHKLAAAQAALGEFRKAEETAQRAIELAQDAGYVDLVGELQRNLSFYRTGKPLTEVSAR